MKETKIYNRYVLTQAELHEMMNKSGRTVCACHSLSKFFKTWLKETVEK